MDEKEWEGIDTTLLNLERGDIQGKDQQHQQPAEDQGEVLNHHQNSQPSPSICREDPPAKKGFFLNFIV